MTEETLGRRYLAACHPDILPEVYDLFVKYFGEPATPDPTRPNGAWIEEQAFLFMEEITKLLKPGEFHSQAQKPI
jgi:hypothetical protein